MKLIQIDRMSEKPIRRQIYAQIRDQIVSGEMCGGEPLPSTRQLAAELGAARSTVVEAYDMLLAEGYLLSRQGAQTVVSENLVTGAAIVPIRRDQTDQKQKILADFSTGRPDLFGFPRSQWAKLLSGAVIELPPEQYGYTGPQGYAPLREEIASWLMRGRGLNVSAEDIFITAGATHALRILMDLLCPHGERVILEDPCHSGLYGALLSCGCEIVPAEADDHGLKTDLLTGAEHAKMIYVTPSHQFPLGGILPASRRAALIRYARENDVYIVEDDYDSEFRYTGAPVAPLLSLDAQRVIYVGTFSKTAFPAMRLGFVILPSALQTRWRELRTHHDVQNPPFEQAALCEFLKSRRFDRHIRAMRNRYGKRRQALMEALTNNFGTDWSPCGDAAGLHVTIRFPGRRFGDAFRTRCAEHGIQVVPLEDHSIIKGKHEDELVMGYGHLETEAIESGVRLLAEMIAYEE